MEFRVANVTELDLHELGWLHPFFDVGWLASATIGSQVDGGKLLMANTYGCDKDYLLLPSRIDTYRDPFATSVTSSNGRRWWPEPSRTSTTTCPSPCSASRRHLVRPGDERQVVKIVVAGYVAQFPVAGLFWHHISYVLGFRDLGHEVWFLEDAGDGRWGWDLDRHRLDPECRAGVRYLEREMRELGLQGRWVFRHLPSGRHDGLDEVTTLDVLAEADVLVNVSCTTPMRLEYLRVPHRLAIDTDPVYTQIRVREGPLAHVVDNHTRLFTFGRPPLPAQQHEWVPTRQPVVARYWPITPPPADAPFATIGQWRSEWAVSWNGESYQGKDATFQPYLDLPSRSAARFRIALGGRDEGMGADLLGRHGWEIADSVAASRSSAAYRAFIAASAGEFSVAKHGYVAPRSGWFSERTCCFLASGRPAVVQDTGFSDWLPTGSGLLTFSTPDQALAAVERVRSDPWHHAQAARALVVEHFDGARVCAELLEAAL